MHDLCIRGKSMELSGNTVIKSGSYGEKEVALADRHVGSIGSVHAKIADI